MIKRSINIEEIGVNCEGIARIDNKVYFIKGAIPGDIVDINIVKDKGRYAMSPGIAPLMK